LKKPPLFLLIRDYSMNEAYKADIVVDIGATIEKKLLGCDAHASQYYAGEKNLRRKGRGGSIGAASSHSCYVSELRRRAKR